MYQSQARYKYTLIASQMTIAPTVLLSSGKPLGHACIVAEDLQRAKIPFASVCHVGTICNDASSRSITKRRLFTHGGAVWYRAESLIKSCSRGGTLRNVYFGSEHQSRHRAPGSS